MRTIVAALCLALAAPVSAAVAEPPSTPVPAAPAAGAAPAATAPRPASREAEEKARQEEGARRKEQEQALRKELEKARQEMRVAERQRREAQRELQRISRELARQKMEEVQVEKLPGHAGRRFVWVSERARLGLVLQVRPDEKTDAVGALVEAVTPGGPAEEAGVHAGDIIVSVDGHPLVTGGAKGDEDTSAPAERLLELTRHLEDGQEVQVTVRRGKEVLSLHIKARRLDALAFAAPPDLPDVDIIRIAPEVPEIPEIPEVPDVARLKHLELRELYGLTGPWADMELVTVDKGLGRYFGTDTGLLVVHPPRDTSLKLAGGDVILRIGDREPETPTQALRILRTYEPGETVKLEIMRDHKRMSLSVTVPERHGRADRDEGRIRFEVRSPGDAPEGGVHM